MLNTVVTTTPAISASIGPEGIEITVAGVLQAGQAEASIGPEGIEIVPIAGHLVRGLVASIGPEGIEMGSAGRPAQYGRLLQSDQKELK